MWGVLAFLFVCFLCFSLMWTVYHYAAKDDDPPRP